MAFDFGIFSNIINGLDLGIGGTLVPLILTTIILFAITTNTRHIKLAAFPLAIGLNSVGLNMHYIILTALGILWAVTLVGTHEIGTILTSIPSMIKERVVVYRKTKTASEYRQHGLQSMGIRPTVQKFSKANQLLKNTQTQSERVFKQDFANALNRYGNDTSGQVASWEEAKHIQNMYREHGINIRPKRKIRKIE